LALVSLMLPVVYVGKSEASAIATFTFLDYGTGFLIAVMLAVVLLATAAVTRGRYHLAARVAGAVTALFGLVDVLAQSPRADLYATNVSADMHEQLAAHVSTGYLVGIAAAVLLVAACALVHHGGTGGSPRTAPRQPGFGAAPAAHQPPTQQFPELPQPYHEQQALPPYQHAQQPHAQQAHAQQPQGQPAWATQPPQPPVPQGQPQQGQPQMPQGQPQPPQGLPPQSAYPSQPGPQPPHADRG
ncbi:MAG: hypothetical protein WCA46_18100, partial [Actinocatenispora sp.]